MKFWLRGNIQPLLHHVVLVLNTLCDCDQVKLLIRSILLLTIGGNRTLSLYGESAHLHSQCELPGGPGVQMHRPLATRLPPQLHRSSAVPRLLSSVWQPAQ